MFPRLRLNWLEGVETVAVTAGASTPTLVVREVISFLEKFDPEDPATHHTGTEIPIGKNPAEN